MQKVVMCDNIIAAKNSDMTKDTYESVAFLRYGFNFDNPNELYVCKKLNKSRQFVISELTSGDIVPSTQSIEQLSQSDSPFRRSKR